MSSWMWALPRWNPWRSYWPWHGRRGAWLCTSRPMRIFPRRRVVLGMGPKWDGTCSLRKSLKIMEIMENPSPALGWSILADGIRVFFIWGLQDLPGIHFGHCCMLLYPLLVCEHVEFHAADKTFSRWKQGDVGLVLEDAKGFSHVLWKKNLEDMLCLCWKWQWSCHSSDTKSGSFELLA